MSKIMSDFAVEMYNLIVATRNAYAAGRDFCLADKAVCIIDSCPCFTYKVYDSCHPINMSRMVVKSWSHGRLVYY
jgi:hypothetical protein